MRRIIDKFVMVPGGTTATKWSCGHVPKPDMSTLFQDDVARHIPTLSGFGMRQNKRDDSSYSVFDTNDKSTNR